MSKPYMTRQGGATVTVFVPYDCGNNCPFCINKAEYTNSKDFSTEKICSSISLLHSITPECDFVFTGGEPLADLEELQIMLDCVPEGHRIFINTTLPTVKKYTEDDIAAFLNRNNEKITCVNISRHLRQFVAEGGDDILNKIEAAKRINCVIFGEFTAEELRAFIERFKKHNVPVQFRSDYTRTTPENLYEEENDDILKALDSILGCTGASGCRIRCNYDFGSGSPAVSYHKTLPYSTIPLTVDGIDYDVLYDVIIKQNGDIHSDWTGVLMDIEAYKNVRFEPYDLHDFNYSGNVSK